MTKMRRSNVFELCAYKTDNFLIVKNVCQFDCPQQTLFTLFIDLGMD